MISCACSSLFAIQRIVSGASFDANTHCAVAHALDSVVIPHCLGLIAITLLFSARALRKLFDDEIFVCHVQIGDDFKSIRFVEEFSDESCALFVCVVSNQFNDIVDRNIDDSFVGYRDLNRHTPLDVAFQNGSTKNQTFLIFTKESSFYMKFCHMQKVKLFS